MKNVVIEENNDTSLPTGSEVIKISSNISNGVTVPNEGLSFEVEIELRSNRLIQCEGILSDKFREWINSYSKLYSDPNTFITSIFIRLELHGKETKPKAFLALEGFDIQNYIGSDSDGNDRGSTNIEVKPKYALEDPVVTQGQCVNLKNCQNKIFSNTGKVFFFSNLAFQNKGSYTGEWGQIQSYSSKVGTIKNFDERFDHRFDIKIVPFIKGVYSKYRSEADYGAPKNFYNLNVKTYSKFTMKDFIDNFARGF